jgi:hypothetical protein
VLGSNDSVNATLGMDLRITASLTLTVIVKKPRPPWLVSASFVEAVFGKLPFLSRDVVIVMVGVDLHGFVIRYLCASQICAMSRRKQKHIVRHGSGWADTALGNHCIRCLKLAALKQVALKSKADTPRLKLDGGSRSPMASAMQR